MGFLLWTLKKHSGIEWVISGRMCHQANVNEQMWLAVCLPVPHGHCNAEVELVQNHQVKFGLMYLIERRDEGRNRVVSSVYAGDGQAHG